MLLIRMFQAYSTKKVQFRVCCVSRNSDVASIRDASMMQHEQKQEGKAKAEKEKNPYDVGPRS